MISPISFVNKEEELINLNSYNYNRGNLIIVSIADIHFGALNSKYQYDILKEQFLNKLEGMYFDILTINGDLFDYKSMANSEPTLYATLFVNDCVNICTKKNASMIILAGTKEHDAGQYRLFYHYLRNKNMDIRIVETTKFEYVKGAKILCIPEEYGKGKDYYNHFLLYSGHYDMCIMHGMFEGAVYQDKVTDIDSDRAPTFAIDNFVNCRGAIISGHVHTPGCFNNYFYYCGSPYRWKFGEEHDKGFLVILHDLDNSMHYVHFEKIISLQYITINVDDLLKLDPNEAVNIINQYKESHNIDYLRLETLNVPEDVYLANIDIIKKYYRNNNTVKVNIENNKQKEVINENNDFLEQYKEFQFILDKSLNEHEILTKYINTVKGYTYVTVEELLELLTE